MPEVNTTTVQDSDSPELLSMDLNLPRSTLIKNLQANALRVYEIGREIQVYPLGFLRLPFMENRHQNGHALHVWMNDSPWKDEFNLHTHIFHLRSRVLRGQVRDKAWSVLADQGGRYRLVRPQYQEGRMVLDEGERVRVEQGESRDFSQDEVYAVEKGTFHSSEVNDGTVSLIEKSQVDPTKDPLVVLPVDMPTQDGGFDTSQFPQDEAWKIVHQTLQELRETIA